MRVDTASPLLAAAWTQSRSVLMSHTDRVCSGCPRASARGASTDQLPQRGAWRIVARRLYGVQFHPRGGKHRPTGLPADPPVPLRMSAARPATTIMADDLQTQLTAAGAGSRCGNGSGPARACPAAWIPRVCAALLSACHSGQQLRVRLSSTTDFMRKGEADEVREAVVPGARSAFRPRGRPRMRFLGAAGRRDRSGAEAQDHRRGVRPCL